MISRILHGQTRSLLSDENAGEGAQNPADGSASSPKHDPRHWPFGYLFKDLQSNNDDYLLPATAETVMNLRKLGDVTSMGDNLQEVRGIPVPTAYTFLGQFIDHDITRERTTENEDLTNPNLMPIGSDEVEKRIFNFRSPNLELDSVYGDNELTDAES